MFNAILLDRHDGRTVPTLGPLDESRLPPGDVTVRVEYSSLNYKDALAVTGRGAIVKNWPLIPGIDLSGVVEESADDRWHPGDRVVVNGWGLGESHWGGLSQRARLSADWLLRLPDSISTWQAMAVGTAGYTAALCVMSLQEHGLSPGDGEVLVTGASGGVGSVAVTLLAGLGYSVVASTGRPRETAYLEGLGAARVIDRAELATPGKPLQKERWAGVVDTVGSHTLANACASAKWNSAVTACGLAQGPDFPASVMPFILRGVTLYGINCVYVPNQKRGRAWSLLETHVVGSKLDAMTEEIGLSGVVDASAALLDAKLKGRTVVDVDR
jgi:acrylyl-CoA reductase (NADPH)